MEIPGLNLCRLILGG